MRSAALCVLSGFLLVPLCRAQTAGTDSTKPVTTIRTQAKLVVVDVVVTGKDQVPYHGLTQADFKVFDKGVPQTIRFFEEHVRPPASAVPAPAPPMPAGTYTNYAAAPTDSTLNVLLLDTLNTPLSDQNYYNSQVKDFLTRLRPGSAVAIFTLGARLRLLQGFTTDREALLASLKAPRNRSSPLLDSPADGVNRVEGVDALIETQAEAGSLNDNLALVASQQKALELRERVTLSVEELSTMARYLSGIAGRKNLVWATGGFPLSISPTIGGGFNTFHEVTSFEPEFRGAIKLLAQSQTAVYTIAPQGLTTLPSGDIRNQFKNVEAAIQADGAAFAAQVDVHGMMNMISSETGGRAYYWTNAVGEATQQAVEEGSTYYTLAFVPTVTNGKQEYHPLSVKLTRAGYDLRYRHGYYPELPAPAAAATAATPSPEIAAIRVQAAALNSAMGHGVPGAGQILYKVRILPATASTDDLVAHGNLLNKPGMAPAKPPYRRMLVDFAADPRDFAFTRTEEGKLVAHLRFVTLLYLPTDAWPTASPMRSTPR